MSLQDGGDVYLDHPEWPWTFLQASATLKACLQHQNAGQI
jgi:hypothetical protein